MIFWTVKHVLISLVFILLIHYIYNFFKNNLTIPKVKDLVSKPQQQYNKIFDVMKNSKENQTEKNIIYKPIYTTLSLSHTGYNKKNMFDNEKPIMIFNIGAVGANWSLTKLPSVLSKMRSRSRANSTCAMLRRSRRGASSIALWASWCLLCYGQRLLGACQLAAYSP